MNFPQKIRVDIVYLQGHAYEHNGTLISTFDLTIQIIEYASTCDRILDRPMQIIEDKYNPLINAIRARGWEIKPS